MPTKDLPGFYFDPEKNRYFPVKGPVPGCPAKRPAVRQPEQGCNSRDSRKVKRTKAAELLGMRELHGNVFSFKKKRHSFEQMCRDMQASNPVVWKYQNTDGLADSALECFHIVVQTSKGQKITSILSLGSMSGGICLPEFGEAGQYFDCGFNNMPVSVLSHYDKESGTIPSSFWGSAEVSTNFPCSVSSISKIAMPLHGPVDDQMLLQNGLVSTLGCGGSGGSVYVLNLTEPLDFSSSTFNFQRRIQKVASLDCTLWTAVCSPVGKQAAIGTNLGAALINLEYGKISWIYRNKSDIFSEQFDNSGNVIICGHRNGVITFVDIRQRHQRHFQHTRRPPRQAIQPSTNQLRGNPSCPSKAHMPSSVCSLVSLTSDDRYFLGASMDGSIKLFDRRLLERGSVQSYEGHVNSHSHLQLGVDASETRFLSGGEDGYVRIWNIKTAELLFAKRISSSALTTVCWRQNGSDMSNNFRRLDGNPYMADHSWGAWLGSRDGVFYMHGT